MIFVIAGNMNEFLNWCHENNKCPRTEARYLHDEFQIRGYKNPKIIRYGTYWTNPCDTNDYINRADKEFVEERA